MVVKQNTLRSRLRSRKSDDRGAAAVEFALVMPLLSLFLFGIITYGYILSLQQSVTQSAIEGARAAAISSSETTTAQKANKARAAINNNMNAYGMKCNDNLTCKITTAPCVGDTASTCATVQVSYDWRSNPRVPGLPILPTPKTIDHKAVVEVN